MKSEAAAERNVHESERMLSTLLANLPGMVYRCRNDEKWTMEFVSEGCRELTGYAPEDLVANRRISYEEIILPVDRGRVREEVGGALLAGRRFELTYRIVTATGRERWVLEHGVIIPMRDEGVGFLEGFITDITARKCAEDALAEKESMLVATLDNSFQFTGLLDPTGRVIRANQTSLEAVGARNEAVVGRYFWETPWWTHSAAEQKKLREAIDRAAAGEFVRYETTHPTKDGRRLTIDFSLKPVRNPVGNIIALIPEGRDITESKEAERALRESEDRFSKAFRASPDAISIVDLETGRILEINHAVERIFGFTERDVIGRTSLELNLWADPRDRQRMVEAIQRDGFVRELQVTGLSKQGKPFVCLFAAEKTEIGGRACLITVIRDITEQVNAQEALRKSEEKFAKAFRASPDAISITDQKTGRFIDVNPGHEKIFGWTRNELLGRSIVELDYYRDPAERERLMAAIRAHGTAYNVELGCYNRRREPITVIFSGESIEVDGRECVVSVVHDITKRKRAERALEESEEKFAKAFQVSPDAISVSDRATGEILEVNGAFEQLAGYAKAELIGMTSQNLNLWSDPGDRQRLLDELRAHGRVREMQVKARKRGGEPRTFLMSAEPIEIAGRACLVILGRDISERVKTDAALRESEEKFAKAFRVSPDAISVSELASGRIIEVNETFERISGYTRAEAIGRTAHDLGLWPEGDREKVIAELRLHGRVREMQIVGRARDGSQRHIQISAESVEIGGRPCLIVLGRDISERVKADAALRESEEKFAKAFRSSPYALTISDLETGRYIDVNWGFERLTGYRREDALGITSFELGIWHDPTDREELLRHLRADGKIRGLELKFLTRNREILITRSSCDVIELGGKPCLLNVIEDITERRKAEDARASMEQQMRQAQKLEALGQLAGGIAHDFNNILTGVLAYTELAILDSTEPDAVRKHLAEVGKAGHRARELVRQILAFSRQQVQARSPLRLHPIVTEAVSLLRSSLPSTIEIKMKIDPKTPVVLADATQIHQIVMNLCTNAAHAMRDRSGRLELSLQAMLLDAETCAGVRGLQPGVYAVLTVTDNGHGMDEDTLKRSFEPFFTTKGPGEGTGLGLAVVHGIVEDHDGAITVRSKLGEGTTFQIFLPEHVTLDLIEAAEPVALSPGNGERILFLDDERMIADSACKLLDHLGYRVSEFTDPRAAMNAFEAAPGDYDLVVTDLTMPKFTGIEVARHMLAIRPDVCVLLASGYSGMWTPDKIKRLGLRALIAKPLTSAGLAGAVRKALDANPGSS